MKMAEVIRMITILTGMAALTIGRLLIGFPLTYLSTHQQVVMAGEVVQCKWVLVDLNLHLIHINVIRFHFSIRLLNIFIFLN
jgi:hypothetical protein